VILATTLAGLGLVAGPKPPDDLARFISTCVDGSKQVSNQIYTSVDGKDVPASYVHYLGKPGDHGTFTVHYAVIGQGKDEVVIAFQHYHATSSPVQSSCSLFTTAFDMRTAKQALMARLQPEGVEDVTAERFVLAEPWHTQHEAAYLNPLVVYDIKNHQPIDRMTLQTSDPRFEIFGRSLGPNSAIVLSVFSLSEKDSRDAERAWEKCRKADCSLPH